MVSNNAIIGVTIATKESIIDVTLTMVSNKFIGSLKHVHVVTLIHATLASQGTM